MKVIQAIMLLDRLPRAGEPHIPYIYNLHYCIQAIKQVLCRDRTTKAPASAAAMTAISRYDQDRAPLAG